MSTMLISVWKRYFIRTHLLFTSVEEVVYMQSIAHQCVLERHVSYVQSALVFLSCFNLPQFQLYNLDHIGFYSIWSNFI